MKLLIAIDSTDYKHLADRTLRWASRSGSELRVFAPKNKRKKFLGAFELSNYHWYNDVRPEQLITRQTKEDYAKEHGFDLVLTIPEYLMSWRKGAKKFETEEIIYFTKVVENARRKFEQNERKRIIRFKNGSTMVRV